MGRRERGREPSCGILKLSHAGTCTCTQRLSGWYWRIDSKLFLIISEGDVQLEYFIVYTHFIVLAFWRSILKKKL